METCPACRSPNFPGWRFCEDCGCPKDADPATRKAHLNAHLPVIRKMLARREPPVQNPLGPWRVVGIGADGSQVPVWKDPPVDEAQARAWILWAQKRVSEGKAHFVKVGLISPRGQLVELYPCRPGAMVPGNGESKCSTPMNAASS